MHIYIFIKSFTNLTLSKYNSSQDLVGHVNKNWHKSSFLLEFDNGNTKSLHVFIALRLWYVIFLSESWYIWLRKDIPTVNFFSPICASISLKIVTRIEVQNISFFLLDNSHVYVSKIIRNRISDLENIHICFTKVQ